ARGRERNAGDSVGVGRVGEPRHGVSNEDVGGDRGRNKIDVRGCVEWLAGRAAIRNEAPGDIGVGHVSLLEGLMRMERKFARPGFWRRKRKEISVSGRSVAARAFACF